MVGISAILGTAATAVTIVQQHPPVLPAAALALFLIAGSVALRAAYPYRAPFTLASHIAVHALVLVAFVLSSWEPRGPDVFLRDSWVPLGLGLLGIATSPYRPVRELVLAATGSALLMGAISYFSSERSAPDGVPLATATVSVVAVLAPSLGAAAYSSKIIAALQRWRLRLGEASEALSVDVRDGLTRSVRQDRVTILNRDVVPFFAEVLARPEITERDRERARAIGDDIRGIMVAEADRSWLQVLIDTPSPTRHRPGVLGDSELLAPLMGSHQRTALRALIVALGDDPRADGVRVTLSPDAGRCLGVLTVKMDAPEHSIRSSYGPYFAIVTIAFSATRVEYDSTHLIVRFAYDRS